MRSLKKRYAVGALAAVVMVAGWFFSGCTNTDIANLDSRGKNVICFGDSITQGFGAAAGQDYPTLLNQMTRFHIINAGIEGDTSGGALKRLKTDVLDREPLLVVIEFGANDFLTRVPLEETVSNMQKLITQVQAAGAMVAIADVSSPEIMGYMTRELQRLARQHKAIYIPRILDGIITNPKLKSDPFHPNAEGYKIIASRMYRALIPYLSRNELIKRMQR